MNLTEPIRDKRQVRQLINYYAKTGEIRNYLMITLCVYTALRISDVLRINCNDVYDFSKKKIHKKITITEKKTGKSKTIALHKDVIKALKAYLPNAEPNRPLILNKQTGKAISRIQAHRLIKVAAEAVKISQHVSCHSLRKTFGYHSFKNNVSPVILMEIYNHSSFAITRRYIGLTQDDKNAVYLQLDLTA